LRSLIEWVVEGRGRTLELVADLSDAELMGPRLRTVNPLRWEIGHVGWFQEQWVLRHGRGRPPLRSDGDALYDSAVVAHDTRWDLALPSREETVAYLRTVCDHVVEGLAARDVDARERYFVLLSIFHEDMHAEAMTYTRQTLGYPAPRLGGGRRESGRAPGGPLPGDTDVPGGIFRLGATAAEPFVFDNEKWAHEVSLRAFALARAPVTQAEFADFVDDGGYRRRDLWSAAGWAWREGEGAEHPLYWRAEAPGRWLRRDFDRWVSLEPYRPVVHVNWHEAEAWCRWARRRLPTELEWEVAAAGQPGTDGRLSPDKRRFPWGDAPPGPERAALDWRSMGCVDVGALEGGDSAFGCRQMIGNVWEWTASDFGPYPGFERDPYKEYSEPWFDTHKVLRGGSWVTRSRLLRNTWRNFYEPDRRDVWAGFRTCALDP
jgi:iron(II)-dependent oxidoreductase